jgi:hypothetical protein
MKLPIQAQPVMRNNSTAKIGGGILPGAPLTTTWACFYRGTDYKGEVTIWWGHTPGDAAWACNQWHPGGIFGGGCGGECVATLIG